MATNCRRLDRRGFLTGSTAVIGAAGLPPLIMMVAACGQQAASGSTPAATATSGPVLPRPATPEEALRRLEEGNQRFVAGKPIHPNQTLELRQNLAGSQMPYASILGCGDSRTSPELVFDAGVGDLFVCRVAGNIATPADTASLLYSQAVLGSEVLFVLGHDNCGALKAAIDVANGQPAGEFAPLTDALQPAVAAARGTGATGYALLAAATAANVRMVMAALPRMSTGIAQAVGSGKLTIVGGVLHLADGKVEMLK